MMKRFKYIVMSCLVTFSIARAQNNTQYAQYMFNGLLFNPAYAGSHDALNVTALYRDQWSGVDGAPRGVSVTGHTPLKSKKLNLGFTLEKEQIGLYDHTRATLAYAYRLPLGKGKLSFGINAGIDSRSLNRNLLKVTDSDDPTLYYGSGRSSGFVSGAGAYYHSPSFYIGVAAPSLAGSLQGPGSLVQLHSGALFRLTEQVRLKPSVLLRKQEGSPLYANVSAMFYFREILGVAAGYSYKDTWLTLLDLRINEQLNFGYAYERNTGRLSTFKAGSHEIMLRYIFRYRIGAVNPRFF
jgi:type IX secretion system PorP/SprF family membrane protein